ncbi:hypothetical protein EV651_102468 [Kribbella sp. VKM Ac-2571]|uniref:hypothetical protein n=1 Tax=Kribbella sp. VKM Ac-2571 TaxID=2512222 RepID=UPI00105CAFA0|nr:hypothetical protein [Kribbella sp. VKM Ac-2571]TDO68545.1 hypothetical protein EV651_102468 [Kribbella sp. VKM Ac-2571]
MDWVRRRAGSLLGLGLIGGLVWTTVVTLSMPGWYAPGEDCARKVGAVDAVPRTSWFPPSASCVSGDEVRQYMSTTRSVVLSVVGVLLLLLIAAGLILTVQRLTGAAGPIRTGDDLKRRRRSHLTFGALDMGVAFAFVTFLNAVAIVFGGLPGAILFILTALVGLSAFGTVLDRHMGPLPSSALESRRRGTVAGLATFGIVFAATAVSGQLPFFRFWAVPLSAIAYAAIAAAQWSRVVELATDRPAQR